MRYDKFGQQIYSEDDLCDLYRQDHTRILTDVLIESDISFDQLDISSPSIIQYKESNISLEEFDLQNQSVWFMPDDYINMDICSWVLSKCSTKEEIDRVDKELIMFADRDMLPLLCYMKYLVDTMRKNQILWGVGRGSSTASFVLFLIGIHRINSIKYKLSIDEFLK